MNSLVLKNEALAWLRFGKRMPVVCTEAGPWNADVLGISMNMSIEVEVKVSMQDLKREFKSKRTKHFLYDKDGTSGVPNYFYFFVPPELVEKATALLQEEAPKCGIVAYTPFRWARRGENITVMKRPTKLHGRVPEARLIRTATMRMASELVGMHIALEKVKGLEVPQLEELRAAVVDESRRASGALDVEDRLADLRQRAAELLHAVEGTPIEVALALPDEQLQKWVQTAYCLLGHDESRGWPLRY